MSDENEIAQMVPKALVDMLTAELAHCLDRLKRAAMHLGSDEEFAEGAVARYRAAIAKATGETP